MTLREQDRQGVKQHWDPWTTHCRPQGRRAARAAVVYSFYGGHHPIAKSLCAVLLAGDSAVTTGQLLLLCFLFDTTCMVDSLVSPKIKGIIPSTTVLG